MSTLMQASHQWATRPDDERFTSLTDMLAHCERVQNLSDSRVISSRKLEVMPIEGDYKALGVRAEDRDTLPTNWAFGQLCARAKAPAGYLKALPSPLVADCLNYGFKTGPVDEIGVFTHDDLGGSVKTLAAATGPNYGRVHNAPILRQVIGRFGNGRDGDFRIPGEFGEAVDITKANTTLYASDRDMFIFLADEEHRIEVPGRRQLANGTSLTGSLARGFFMWNSEVGSQTLGISTFLFDYVCCNRMVWGATGLQTVRIRHTSGAPDRFVEEVTPALVAYSQSETASITAAIESARKAKIDEDVSDFLAKRFTGGQVRGIILAHDADEGRPIETLYDAANGITAYARGIPHQDARVAIEREAGKVMALAA